MLNKFNKNPNLLFFFQFFSGRACDLRHARQSNVNPKKQMIEGLACPFNIERIVQLSQTPAS